LSKSFIDIKHFAPSVGLIQSSYNFTISNQTSQIKRKKNGLNPLQFMYILIKKTFVEYLLAKTSEKKIKTIKQKSHKSLALI